MATSFGKLALGEIATPEEEVEYAQGSEGEQGWLDTARAAYGNAALNNVVTSSIVKGFDSIIGDDKRFTVDELKQIYPNAPQEFYKPNLTRYQAALTYAQYEAEDLAERYYSSRDSGTMGRLGYGLIGSLGDPTAIMGGIVGAPLLRGGAAMGLFGKTAKNFIPSLYAPGIRQTVGRILARELGENLVSTAAVDVAAGIYQHKYSHAEVTPGAVLTQIGAGTLLGTGTGALFDHLKFGSKIGEKIAKDSMPSHVSNSVLVETLTKEFADYADEIGAHTPFDALKAGAYNRAKNINTVSDIIRKPGEFFGIKEKITGIDTSFESKYGRTAVLVDDPRISEGIAQTAGADFGLYSVDLTGTKLVNLDTTFSDINPKTFELVNKLLPENKKINLEDFTSTKNRSLQDLFDYAKEVLDGEEEDKFFASLQDEFFKSGFGGYSYIGGKGLQADVAHGVVQLFDSLDDDIISELSNPIKDLNYQNKKMFLEYKPSKKTSIENEGYLSNGKKIKMNEGYFESIHDNPFESAPGELDALKGLFSKEQIDDIALKTSESDFKSIAKNYPDLVEKRDLLLELEERKKFDEKMFGPDESKAEFLIKEQIEKAKENSPALHQEATKATTFCLRK